MALRRVLFSDKRIGQKEKEPLLNRLRQRGIGRKAPLLNRLRQRGIDVAWRENVANELVCQEVLSSGVQVVITNASRSPDGDTAGVDLCHMLRSRGFGGGLVFFSGSLSAEIAVRAREAGADLATKKFKEMEAFLETSLAMESGPKPEETETSAACEPRVCETRGTSSSITSHLVQEGASKGLLDIIPSIARRVDCIVNSANSRLLTSGCTGIAGALLKAGGAAIQKESDAAKAAAGGAVPIGRCVITGGGTLPCKVVHAVALAYEGGSMVPATPEAVRHSSAAALRLAIEHGARTVATKLMCARPGYSTVDPPSDAPKVMLRAMLAAIEDVAPAPSDIHVFIFLPASSQLLPLLASEGAGIVTHTFEDAQHCLELFQ